MAVIHGAHALIYSLRPEADRAFFRDVLRLPSVDVGEGWLIFGLPPAEVAVHPARKNGVHELYLMCEDLDAFVAAMRRRRIRCTPAEDQGYGIFTRVTLPGGGRLGVYQPRHARPKPMRAKRSSGKGGSRGGVRRARAAPRPGSARRAHRP